MGTQKVDLQVRILELELAKVKAEAAQLRKKLGENGRHPKRVQNAKEDAILLATIKIAGVHPSRRLAVTLGMSESRWNNAVALLKLARVITRSYHWEVSDLPTIERQLTTAEEKAKRDVNLFFLRHCRHGEWR